MTRPVDEDFAATELAPAFDFDSVEPAAAAPAAADARTDQPAESPTEDSGSPTAIAPVRTFTSDVLDAGPTALDRPTFDLDGNPTAPPVEPTPFMRPLPAQPGRAAPMPDAGPLPSSDLGLYLALGVVVVLIVLVLAGLVLFAIA